MQIFIPTSPPRWVRTSACSTLLGRTADVEGPHGQLGAGLTNGLGGNNTDGLADVDHVTAAEIAAIALGADTALGLTGQHRTDHDLINAGGLDSFHPVLGDFLIHGRGLRPVWDRHIFKGHTPKIRSPMRTITSPPSISGSAAMIPRMVPQSFSTMVESWATSTRRRVRYPEFAVFSAVSARPLRAPWVEMKYSRTLQALPKIGLDRCFDDLAGGLGHQAAHTGKLPDLILGTAGAGISHDINGVETLDLLDLLSGALVRTRTPFHPSSSLATLSVIFDQISTILLYFSPSVIKPSEYC
jgi:hypothetical protein